MSARTPALRAVFLALLAYPLALVSSAHAHKPSDAFLSFDVAGRTVTGHLEVAVRDLHAPLSLDPSGDGAITWGELRARAPALRDYVQARLRLTDGDAPCSATLGALEVTRRDGQAHVRLPLRAECTRVLTRLGVGYGLFAEFDPTHRGRLRVTAMGATHSGVLTPTHAMLPRTFDLGGDEGSFAQLCLSGARRVLLGLEPWLLLFVLLLPVLGLGRAPPHVDAAADTAPSGAPFAWFEVALVISLFALASAVTMVLSATGIVAPPARWSQCGLALAVLITALANFSAAASGRRWRLALLLGLIHGFGVSNPIAFAVGAALAPATEMIALVLGGIGGLLLSSLALSSLGLFRGTWAYRRIALSGGSAAVAVTAAFWALERFFDVPIWAL